jgi:hypothetical protein
MSKAKTKRGQLDALVHDLGQSGQSVYVTLGDHLDSVIQSAEYDEASLSDLFDLVEGELEQFGENGAAAMVLKDVRAIREAKAIRAAEVDR